MNEGPDTHAGNLPISLFNPQYGSLSPPPTLDCPRRTQLGQMISVSSVTGRVQRLTIAIVFLGWLAAFCLITHESAIICTCSFYSVDISLPRWSCNVVVAGTSQFCYIRVLFCLQPFHCADSRNIVPLKELVLVTTIYTPSSMDRG